MLRWVSACMSVCCPHGAAYQPINMSEAAASMRLHIIGCAIAAPVSLWQLLLENPDVTQAGRQWLT